MLVIIQFVLGNYLKCIILTEFYTDISEERIASTVFGR